MASSGNRPIVFDFLSKTDRFDLTRAAGELDDLGAAARDTSRDLEDLERADPQLDRVEDEARDAERALGKLGRESDETRRDVDQLGDQARDTAKRVDDAFDAIARSSKRAGDDVSRDMDRAGEGLDEFKDEAASTGREAAASFSGSMDDITGAIQEVAANAFAGFGPAGMLAGVAAAAGIGAVITSITEANERVKELSAELLDIKLDPDLQGNADQLGATLRRIMDARSMAEWSDLVRRAGLDWDDFLDVMTRGADSPAWERVNSQLTAAKSGYLNLAGVFGDVGRAATDLSGPIWEAGQANADAAASAQVYADTVGKITPELEDLADALVGFVEPAGIYSDLLADKAAKEREAAEATAKATKSQSDSWEDYAKDVSVSVDEYLDELERQVSAQETWAANLETLARRGVQDGVLAQLADLGPEGAPLVAALTSASDAELARLVELYGRRGQQAADAHVDAIAGMRGRATGAARGVRDAVAETLTATQPTLDVLLRGPGAAAVASVRSVVQSQLGRVVVPVMLQNVETSIWSKSRYAP